MAWALSVLACRDDGGPLPAPASPIPASPTSAGVADPGAAPPRSATFGPIGAGMTYPATSRGLDELLDDIVQHVPQPVGSPHYRLGGVLLPYGPLGEVAIGALAGWKLLGWSSSERAVLLIPTSSASPARVAVPDFDRWTGPWGEIPIDRQGAQRLADRHDFIDAGPGPFRTAAEAEAQLPLLHAVAAGVRLLPIVLGDDTAGLSRKLSLALLEDLEWGSGTLVLALGAPQGAAAGLMADLSVKAVRQAVRDGAPPVGPLGAVATLLDMTRALGGDPPRALHESEGRGSMALLAPMARGPDHAFKPPAPPEDSAWTQKTSADVLEIANKMVIGHVVMSHRASFQGMKGALGSPGGAWVSLRVAGVLRGRSGGGGSGAPLGQAIADAAYDAVVRAKPALTRGDLSTFEVEVTLHGASEDASVDDLAKARPGARAIGIAARGRQGVVLPQDAAALGWSGPVALRHACIQVGLPAECRRDPSVIWKTYPVRVLRSDASKPLPVGQIGPARQYGPAGSGLGLAPPTSSR